MYILSDFQYLRQLHHTMLRPHKLRYELLHYNLSDDTNTDGVLDENDDIITLSNTYTTTTQKTRTV